MSLIKSGSRRVASVIGLQTLLLLLPVAGQGASSAVQPATSGEAARGAVTETSEPVKGEVIDKRIFGVLPNYRTADGTIPYAPITAHQKMMIGLKDSFDKPVYMVSASFALLGQLEDSNPDFGQGLKGYGKRYATSFADQVIGNLMTESLMPSLLHEDPRYFRIGAGGGSGWKRTGYALSRVLVTRTDSGGTRFNYSEVVGNSVATAISNFYYPQSRTISDNTQKLGIQVATDAFSNVLKEFWPDVKRKMFKHKGSH